MLKDKITEQELLHQFKMKKASISERIEFGKKIRMKVPRASHAEYTPSASRNIVAVIQAQAKSRLQHLVPVRHARMLTSPFAFFRGAAAIMAQDLAGSPATNLFVQACGDMHVANFGVYASAERNLVFGINDFDETLRAAWEWDLKRLVASVIVSQRHLGATRKLQLKAAHAAVFAYRERIRVYANASHLSIWYAHIESSEILKKLSPQLHQRANKLLTKALSHDNLQVLKKMTELVDDAQQIIEQRPLIVRATHTSKGRPIDDAMANFLQQYLHSLSPEKRILLQRYRIVDVAQKVVGVGSVGTRCWVVFMLGNSGDDPLFLQIKEAQSSVLAPHFKSSPEQSNHGLRVVIGQRLTQGSPDIFLGWGKLDGVHFYVRQLRDMKGGVDFVPGVTNPAHQVEYAGLCGWALALAHAKSGDSAAISGYLGASDEFLNAIVEFSVQYADQNDRDYTQFQQAVRDGKISCADII